MMAVPCVLSRADKDAFLLCAAMHTKGYLRRISGCLDLLIPETGANLQPTDQQVKQWADTMAWPNTLIEKEVEELRAAIAGEDPSAKPPARMEDVA